MGSPVRTSILCLILRAWHADGEAISSYRRLLGSLDELHCGLDGRTRGQAILKTLRWTSTEETIMKENRGYEHDSISHQHK